MSGRSKEYHPIVKAVRTIVPVILGLGGLAACSPNDSQEPISDPVGNATKPGSTEVFEEEVYSFEDILQSANEIYKQEYPDNQGNLVALGEPLSAEDELTGKEVDRKHIFTLEPTLAGVRLVVVTVESGNEIVIVKRVSSDRAFSNEKSIGFYAEVFNEENELVTEDEPFIVMESTLVEGMPFVDTTSNEKSRIFIRNGDGFDVIVPSEVVMDNFIKGLVRSAAMVPVSEEIPEEAEGEVVSEEVTASAESAEEEVEIPLTEYIDKETNTKMDLSYFEVGEAPDNYKLKYGFNMVVESEGKCYAEIEDANEKEHITVSLEAQYTLTDGSTRPVYLYLWGVDLANYSEDRQEEYRKLYAERRQLTIEEINELTKAYTIVSVNQSNVVDDITTRGVYQYDLWISVQELLSLFEDNSGPFVVEGWFGYKLDKFPLDNKNTVALLNKLQKEGYFDFLDPDIEDAEIPEVIRFPVVMGFFIAPSN